MRQVNHSITSECVSGAGRLSLLDKLSLLAKGNSNPSHPVPIVSTTTENVVQTPEKTMEKLSTEKKVDGLFRDMLARAYGTSRLRTDIQSRLTTQHKIALLEAQGYHLKEINKNEIMSQEDMPALIARLCDGKGYINPDILEKIRNKVRAKPYGWLDEFVRCGGTEALANAILFMAKYGRVEVSQKQPYYTIEMFKEATDALITLLASHNLKEQVRPLLLSLFQALKERTCPPLLRARITHIIGLILCAPRFITHFKVRPAVYLSTQIDGSLPCSYFAEEWCAERNNITLWEVWMDAIEQVVLTLHRSKHDCTAMSTKVVRGLYGASNMIPAGVETQSNIWYRSEAMHYAFLTTSMAALIKIYRDSSDEKREVTLKALRANHLGEYLRKLSLLTPPPELAAVCQRWSGILASTK